MVHLPISGRGAADPPLTELGNFVTIVSAQHCWRTLGGLETTKYAAVSDAMANGCDIQKVIYQLRHGEVMFADLSNLGSRLARCHHTSIEKIWRMLPHVVAQYIEDGAVRRIVGEDLGAELAYSGPSITALHRLSDAAFAHIMREHSDIFFDYEEQCTARGLQKDRDLYSAPGAVLESYNAFRAFYSEYVRPGNWHSHSALNQNKIYGDHKIWNALSELAENKMFILSAGLALAHGYQAATGDDRLFFCEFHRQNDSTVMAREKDFSGIYGARPPSSNSWLVIDKAYTGGSIRAAAKLIRERYGYDAKITSVAMFPKSLSAVASADYAVFAGRLFHVPNIVGALRIEDWHLQLLRMGNEANLCL